MTGMLRQNLFRSTALALAGLATLAYSAQKPAPAKNTAAKSTKAKAAKAPESKPASKSQAKPAAEAKPASDGKLEELDKLCRRDLSWGKLDAVRLRCADLEPRTSPAATFWRLTLSDDPNDLRKGYSPATLGKGEIDSRLLLSAGRYHFARGQIKEMEDLVEIARKKKLAGLEIDTLKRLASGK